MCTKKRTCTSQQITNAQIDMFNRSANVQSQVLNTNSPSSGQGQLKMQSAACKAWTDETNFCVSTVAARGSQTSSPREKCGQTLCHGEPAYVDLSELQANYQQQDILAEKVAELKEELKLLCSTSDLSKQGHSQDGNEGLSSANADQRTSTTTVMIRNIPYTYTVEELEHDVQNVGFGDLYDFLYLPKQRSCGRNLGYAFLNFPLREHASQFQEVFHRHNFKGTGEAGFRKRATVSEAHYQGYEAIFKKLSKLANLGGRDFVSLCCRMKGVQFITAEL